MMKCAVFLLFCLLWGCNAPAQTVPAKNKGRELYLSYGCALCHGRDGRGDGINAQKFDPPPTNFHDPDAYLHGKDNDSIRRSIQYGIKEESSIMPSFEHIPPDELNEIIDYLQSLQKEGDKK
jgi:mono/diheme cytochrome c family protein